MLKNADYKNHCSINFLGNLVDGFHVREIFSIIPYKMEEMLKEENK
jgi:hypothetical protein